MSLLLVTSGCGNEDEPITDRTGAEELYHILAGEWRLSGTQTPQTGDFIYGTWDGTYCSFSPDSMYVYEYIVTHHYDNLFTTYLYSDTIREDISAYSIRYENTNSVLLSDSIRLRYQYENSMHKLSGMGYAFIFHAKK